MENKSPQAQRVKYTGRFATEADSAPPRAAAPVRPRAAGTDAQSPQRPSGFAHTQTTKRRVLPQAAAAKPAEQKPAEKPKREKKIRNKRTAGQGSGRDWKLPLLIGLGLLILLAVILALTLGGRKGTYHQLPRVERSDESAFMPEETQAPEATAEPEIPAAEEPSAFDDADFGNEDNLPDISGAFDAVGTSDDGLPADVISAFEELEAANSNSADDAGEVSLMDAFAALQGAGS